MSFRPGFRPFQQVSRAFRLNSIRQPIFRRRVQTAAEANVEQSAFRKFWDNPIGPKTVHFWAPIMKWALVLAGVSDFARPAETLSLSQNAALTATGAIWTRWCLIIHPKNIFLATVNFFVFCVGCTQVTRIFFYHQRLKSMSPAERAKLAAQSEVETVKAAVEDPQGAADRATMNN